MPYDDFPHELYQKGWAKKQEKRPDWWDKKDATSMARQLRLGAIQNVLKQGLITEADAKELLSGPLEPGNQNTIYDDSEWINFKIQPSDAVEPHKDAAN